MSIKHDAQLKEPPVVDVVMGLCENLDKKAAARWLKRLTKGKHTAIVTNWSTWRALPRKLREDQRRTFIVLGGGVRFTADVWQFSSFGVGVQGLVNVDTKRVVVVGDQALVRECLDSELLQGVMPNNVFTFARKPRARPPPDVGSSPFTTVECDNDEPRARSDL